MASGSRNIANPWMKSRAQALKKWVIRGHIGRQACQLAAQPTVFRERQRKENEASLNQVKSPPQY